LLTISIRIVLEISNRYKKTLHRNIQTIQRFRNFVLVRFFHRGLQQVAPTPWSIPPPHASLSLALIDVVHEDAKETGCGVLKVFAHFAEFALDFMACPGEDERRSELLHGMR
jgi:hypothetical protein